MRPSALPGGQQTLERRIKNCIFQNFPKSSKTVKREVSRTIRRLRLRDKGNGIHRRWGRDEIGKERLWF